jgi:5'(3')-deoxyribonucleotidase
VRDKPLALVDLDGTLADYDGSLVTRMRRLQAPSEVPYCGRGPDGDESEESHTKARRRLVQGSPGFWRGLERIPRGFEVVDILRSLGFDLHVLSKGPRNTPSAWSEKMEWCKKQLDNVPVTVTSDKSLMYGRVLVDDWPTYFLPWLEVRPRGLVVCVAQPWNEGADKHPRVVRYTGRNVAELKARLREVR